jgi:hypothetical protein
VTRESQAAGPDGRGRARGGHAMLAPTPAEVRDASPTLAPMKRNPPRGVLRDVKTRSSARTGDAASQRGSAAGPLGRAPRALLAATLLVLLSAGAVPLAQAADAPAQAADAPASEITMRAEPLLGGKVRRGEWAAVRVHLENDGPAVDGELRIATSEQGASTYGTVVQLATGARQDHIIYGRAGFVGPRFTVDLVSGGAAMATAKVTVQAVEPQTLGVVVVAEHPERLVGDIRGSVATRRGLAALVVAIGPEDLPPRVEAWASVDRLVWQDIAAARLTVEQLDALKTWVALGGELVILGGSTGVASIDAFPDDLLPYQPEGIVDVPVADLGDLLGVLPAGATSLPAVSGRLQHGAVLGESGGQTIAARMSYGQGSVTLMGVDPTASWLAGSAAAGALWARLVPADVPAVDDQGGQDDSELVNALGYLPSVEIPRMDHLFLLFLGYVILLGPVSYLVLRRLDRREWAWFTIPALAVAFTVAAFMLGIVLRGSSVVVNELGVVRGAAGTDRGVADVYVGIFSPSRATFDVRLPGGAFISRTITGQQEGSELPLDVLVGDPARLRGFGVGYGTVRGFRAEAAVETPRMDADLRLAGDHLQGNVTNASGGPLERVSLVYGGGSQVLADMAPGETRSVDIDLADRSASRIPLLRRLFAGSDASDPESGRRLASRLALITHLAGGCQWCAEVRADDLSTDGPVILAWRSGSILDVDVGVAADQVGDTVFVLPVRVAAAGPVAFTGNTLGHSVVSIDAVDSWLEEGELGLGRGTATVAYRPAGFEGAFEVTGLALRLGQEEQMVPAVEGDVLAPLPDQEQPDQGDPVGTGAGGAPGDDGPRLPHVQLFDRDARTWIEFGPMKSSRTYRIADPERYVDASGGLLVRFVNRIDDMSPFALGVRLEGTVR